MTTWNTCEVPTSNDRLTAAQRKLRDLRRKSLGQAIIAARHDVSMTQEELAKASGISRPTIARLEAGTHTVNVDRLFELADALGIPASPLIAAAEADMTRRRRKRMT